MLELCNFATFQTELAIDCPGCKIVCHLNTFIALKKKIEKYTILTTQTTFFFCRVYWINI